MTWHVRWNRLCGTNTGNEILTCEVGLSFYNVDKTTSVKRSYFKCLVLS